MVLLGYDAFLRAVPLSAAQDGAGGMPRGGDVPLTRTPLAKRRRIRHWVRHVPRGSREHGLKIEELEKKQKVIKTLLFISSVEKKERTNVAHCENRAKDNKMIRKEIFDLMRNAIIGNCNCLEKGKARKEHRASKVTQHGRR